MPEHDSQGLPEAYPRTMREWCALTCRGSVVLRGLKFCLVVGAILIGINHGDAILAGELTRTSYLKMGLTVIVPYLVSVFSSVGAMMENGRAARDPTRTAFFTSPDSR